MSREEFLKYGRDLEASKDKDMDRYHDVERQIKESYRHCGAVLLLLPSSSGGFCLLESCVSLCCQCIFMIELALLRTSNFDKIRVFKIPIDFSIYD